MSSMFLHAVCSHKKAGPGSPTDPGPAGNTTSYDILRLPVLSQKPAEAAP